MKSRCAREIMAFRMRKVEIIIEFVRLRLKQVSYYALLPITRVVHDVGAFGCVGK